LAISAHSVLKVIKEESVITVDRALEEKKVTSVKSDIQLLDAKLAHKVNQDYLEYRVIEEKLVKKAKQESQVLTIQEIRVKTVYQVYRAFLVHLAETVLKINTVTLD
jgi:hypothetical protein